MKKLPQTIYFIPLHRFSQVVYQSIQFDSRNKNKTSKNSKFNSRGAPGEFPLKNTPNDNFLTVQPIFASGIPIDSAEQVEQNRNIKKLKISL